MTEDDAETKWCPFAIGHVWLDHKTMIVGNRKGDDAVGRCVASKCMAWRWTHSPDWVDRGRQEAPMANAREPFTASGYCGLAGAPQ